MVYPLYQFHDDRLIVTTHEGILDLAVCPAIEARMRYAEKAGWEPAVPRMRVVFPEDSAEIPALGPAGRALAEFRAAMPPALARIVEPFRSHQWALLEMMSRSRAAFELALIHPVLAYCAANNDEFLHTRMPQPFRRALGQLHQKQRDLAAWLGFPARDAVVRFLAKLEPSSVTPDKLRLLRNALQVNPGVIALTSHQRRVPDAALGLLLTPRYHPHLTPELLHEVCSGPAEFARLGAERLLMDSLYMLAEMRSTTLPMFRRMGEILRFHDVVLQAYLNRDAQKPTKRDRNQFPPPPIAGTANIVPIETQSQLIREGKEMRHCIATYAKRVQRGTAYVYRVLAPERATLALARAGGGKWKIHEVERAYNHPPLSATMAAIHDWLCAAQECPIS